MNRLFGITHLIKHYSTSPPTKVIEHLKHRTIIRISGNEVDDYIQGLITNDIGHLKYGGCMYALFLNTKGRVLYDTIIYKPHENNTYLIECDLNSSDQLQKHLRIYKLRKKIDIINLSDEIDVFAMYDPININIKKEFAISKSLDGVIVPCETLAESFPKESKTVNIFQDLHIYRDPRMFLLGSRIICPPHINVLEQLSKIHSVTISTKENNYRWFRYSLGVGEGTGDLPWGNCFPLESNCDYLHGISFHKGCYIGQELTARTHHTGVIRKRLMPLYFKKPITVNPTNENIVVNNVNLGKLRGYEGNVGLALLRISQSLEVPEINVGDGIAYTLKPIWWPVEAPKEKHTITEKRIVK